MSKPIARIEHQNTFPSLAHCLFVSLIFLLGPPMLDLISFGEPEVPNEESGPGKQPGRFSDLQSAAYLG